jgi:hypothetical protein
MHFANEGLYLQQTELACFLSSSVLNCEYDERAMCLVILLRVF